MSSEKNPIVRLATLKTPRDLSLGASSGITRGGAVRRKFAPNINAAAAATAAKANQKQEVSSVEVKKEKTNKKRERSQGRREGRGRNDLYAQKKSIFDVMPTTENKSKSLKSGYSYSSTSLHSSSSSSSLRTSRVRVKSENKMETNEKVDAEDGNDDDGAEEDDKEILQKLLSHSLIDDDDDAGDDDNDADIQPLLLPLEGSVKKDFEVHVDIKPPPTGTDTMETDEGLSKAAKVGPVTPTLFNHQHPTRKSEITFKKGECYLVQLPSTLPGTPPISEEEVNNINNNKNNKNKKTDEPAVKKQDRCLGDFPEGLIGRLQVRKGSGTQLRIGKVPFLLQAGPASDCRQELGLVAAGRQKGPYESLYRFGRVSSSLLVHPIIQASSAAAATDEEEDNSEEDAMEEFNVYLCKPADKALYLFNLPLKYGLSQMKTGRLKPQCGKVQFDLEEWPVRQEGSSDVKAKMTSTSCNILPKVFAVGVFSDDQFHLTPLSDIIHMRPEFKSFKKKKQEEEEEERRMSVCEEETQETHLVNAHMKVKETESAKNKRLASFQHLQTEERKEAWHELKFLDPSDYLRESALLASSTQPCDFNMPWEDYVDVLTTDTKPPDGTDTCLSSLQRLKLQEQVKWLVERCKAIDFQQLTSLLPPSAPASEVIGYLEQFSVLIQGCWVVKSEHIIPASDQTGVGLRALRDFVLYKFSHGEGVTRAQLNSLHRMNDDDEAVVLGGISKRDSVLKQRVFALEADEEFVRRNEQVVKRQALLMKHKFEQIKLILTFRNTDHPSTTHKQTHSKKS